MFFLIVAFSPVKCYTDKDYKPIVYEMQNHPKQNQYSRMESSK